MKRRWHSALPFIAPALIGGAVGNYLLDAANNPQPEVFAAVRANAAQARPADPNAPPRRVVVVLLDGVGERYERREIEAGTLRGVRAIVPVDTATPSLSRPGYHALFTGVSQEVSAVRNNRYVGRARFDTLMNRVRCAGGTVAWALETVDWMHTLAGEARDPYLRGAGARDVDAIATMAARHTLTLVHWTRTDEVGHTWGAASAQYAREVHTSMARANRLHEALDARVGAGAFTLFVGSDHGHMARGGHGGPEPEVTEVLWAQLGAIDSTERSHASGRRPVVDVTERIARALRVQTPLHARHDARPLVDRARRDAPRRAVLALAAYVVALVIVAARLRRLRALAAAVALLAAAGVAYAVAGPGFTLSAIRTHVSFLAHAVGALSAGVALAWPLVRAATGAKEREVAVASAAVPFGVVACSHGSAWSLVGDHGLLLGPVSGLFTAACCAALAAWTLRPRAAAARRDGLEDHARQLIATRVSCDHLGRE